MKDLGANSKCLPRWLITPDTSEKKNSANYQPLRPDCVIVGTTQDELDKALKKLRRSDVQMSLP